MRLAVSLLAALARGAKDPSTVNQHFAHQKMVVDANAVVGGVDVFMHSWNPSVSAHARRLYACALVADAHDEPIPGLHKVASQASHLRLPAPLRPPLISYTSPTLVISLCISLL